jgi:hypothetical protein
VNSKNLPRCAREACSKCLAFAPDCDVPVDDGKPRRMCWLCAHAVCAHDAPLTGAPAPCACAAEEIYPEDVLARRRRGTGAPLFSVPPLNPHTQAIGSYVEAPTYMGRDSERYAPIRAAIRAGWEARGGRYAPKEVRDRGRTAGFDKIYTSGMRMGATRTDGDAA